MQSQAINLKAGRKCQLVDASGTFVDGNVLESDVLSFSNDRYRQLYLKVVNKFPSEGQYEEAFNTVADQEFYSFGDYTKEMIVLLYVGIKYTTADADYTRVLRRSRQKLFKNTTSEDGYSTTSPFYSHARDTSGNQGIKITPTPSTAITDGLYVEYTMVPEALSDAADEPDLPELLQDVLVAYMVVDIWEAKRDWANSNQALNRAMLLEKEFFDNYQPTASDQPVKWGVNKIFNPYQK